MYKHVVICSHCKEYVNCKINGYKHPLTKHNLPVYSYVVFEALNLYNKIKIGYTYSAEEMRNTPHKIIKMLEILTSQINENSMNKLSKKE